MNIDLIDRIAQLEKNEIVQLLEHKTAEDIAYAQAKARANTDAVFGKKVFIRGLIEISNFCKNNCYYCGIRCQNKTVSRYRLNLDTVLSCCEKGYRAGFRTFVLQGGEDGFFTDGILTEWIRVIKENYPDCAVTLSLGEQTKSSYQALFDAGADRYLLRHETASAEHYAKLHPETMSFSNRISCLKSLKGIGYQTGCGMMVGSPFQTASDLADDLIFMREFKPHMVGIGPFIPASHTPFSAEKTGSIEETLFLIRLVRLVLPNALIPATTALQTLLPNGRLLALQAGANVVMPNLSPPEERAKYMLYQRKENAFFDTAEDSARIFAQLKDAGYEIVIGRGDYQDHERKE